MDQRSDFSAATQELLARRAGYQCSVLNCGRLTIGPGAASDQVVRTGMAGHIYAASPNGPRGSGGLTTEELRLPGNGIWCCYDHGKAIDSANGTVYSAAQLKAWKRLHEARKGMEVHGLAADRFGLVESITINSAPIAALSGATFDLGMLNIITGRNGTGKTMLARLISTVSDPSYVAELSRSRDIDLAVKWFDPHSHEVSMSGRSGEVRHVLDGQSVPYVARPYKTIMLSGPRPWRSWKLVPLAQLFDLSTIAMKATLKALPETSRLIKEVHLTDHTVEFVVDLNGRTYRVGPDHRGYPGNVDLPIFAELAGSHARHHARVEPTVLILDEFLDRNDPQTQQAALRQLETTAEHAQIAVISHSLEVVRGCGQGWTVTSLPDDTSYGRLHPSRPYDLEITAIDPPVAPGSGT